MIVAPMNGSTGANWRRAPLAICLLTSVVTGVSVAHVERPPGQAQQFAIASGDTPRDSTFQLFAQRARIRRGHVHLGRGKRLCLTFSSDELHASACGMPLMWHAALEPSLWGFRCGPSWSYATGAVSREARRVFVRFAGSDRVRARILKTPRLLGFEERIFLALRRGGTQLRWVRAVGRSGRTIGRFRNPARQRQSCSEVGNELQTASVWSLPGLVRGDHVVRLGNRISESTGRPLSG